MCVVTQRHYLLDYDGTRSAGDLKAIPLSLSRCIVIVRRQECVNSQALGAILVGNVLKRFMNVSEVVVF